MSEQSMTEESKKELDREDFRMWYQITIDDIRFMKNQQWKVTYYVLLLFAGIVGFYRALDSKEPLIFCQRLILQIAGLGVALVGSILVIHFQSVMVDYRQKLINSIIPKLCGVFQVEQDKWSKPFYPSFWKDSFLILVLIITMLFGAYLLTWLP